MKLLKLTSEILASSGPGQAFMWGNSSEPEQQPVLRLLAY